MTEKWRRNAGRRKNRARPFFPLLADADAVARQAMPVIMASPTLKTQLMLFSGRPFVNRSSLDGIFKGGAYELTRQGLVFGQEGGKKFSLTPAGIIVLRILEAGS